MREIFSSFLTFIFVLVIYSIRSSGLDTEEFGVVGQSTSTAVSKKDPFGTVPTEDDSSEIRSKMLDELFEASRGSTMLPLGQDRFCR